MKQTFLGFGQRRSIDHLAAISALIGVTQPEEVGGR
jgi:hypothetical protein